MSRGLYMLSKNYIDKKEIYKEIRVRTCLELRLGMGYFV